MAVRVSIDRAYVEALKQRDPFPALRDAVAAEIAEGRDREDVYQSLRRLRAALQQRALDASDDRLRRGLDAMDDVVVDVMDCLTGFSSSLVAI